ncbi:hypothetical protein C4569_01350 [Candidatus Parcubacteria bacterium]|nr:MAG: hypothetical protein C4569_01350 [Candidatus Parcubacteria bacterium]
MTLESLKKQLNSINLCDCQKINAFWQPSACGNFIYFTTIDNKKWYLERTYIWSKLDQSFLMPRYAQEAEIIWPQNKALHEEILVVFDHKGRLWTREELSGQYLISFYLKNYSEYIRVMAQHFIDVKKMVNIIKEVNTDLENKNKLISNLQKLYYAYQLHYSCPSTIYFVFDKMVYDFKQFLLTFLDKNTTNSYLANFMRAEIIKKLLESNHNFKKTCQNSRGIMFAQGIEPSTFYCTPKFYHCFDKDNEIMEKIIASKDLNKFLAYRAIIPLGFQINEESQYIESHLLSSHLCKLMALVSQKLKLSMEELQQKKLDEIIEIIRNEKPAEDTVIKGIGASQGVARGLVKVIKNSEDKDSFDANNVLVTRITDPSMVSIMSKAAAIVTDIGGITSHPAIISRELGIPCVVGTKNASSVLKDGMKIAVNGTEGTVTILFEKDDDGFNKDCDEMLEAFRRAYKTMDTNTFETSIDYTAIDPYIASLWIKRLLRMIEDTKKLKLPPIETARLFPNPSALRNLVIFDLFMASFARATLQEKKKIALFYFDALKSWCHSHPFALDFKNKIHSPEEIKKYTVKTLAADNNIAKKIGRLINACYHLSYTLYGDMNPQILYENYGPYYIEDEKFDKAIMVIKEFKNLRPVEFIDEIKNFPFEFIKIISIYKNVKFTIDAITHTNYRGDNINGLKFYSLEIDGKKLKNEDIDLATTITENFARLVWNKHRQSGFEKQKIRYLYQKCYNYKNLCFKLSHDWNPENELIEAVKSKTLKEWPKFKSKEDKDEFFLKIIDPRNDFSGT